MGKEAGWVGFGEVRVGLSFMRSTTLAMSPNTSGLCTTQPPLKVLFYSRLFTDLVGRLLPRRRALQLRSGTAILALSAAATSAAALFFVYILAPPRLVARAPRLLRNDAVPLGLVVFLWLTGGVGVCGELAGFLSGWRW